MQTANAHTPRSMILFPTRTDWDTARRDAALATTGHEDMHAGELEASVLLVTYPDAVRTGGPEQDHVADDRRLLLSHGMTAYTDSGVIGRPSAATAQKGHAVLDSLTTSFRHHFQAVAAPGDQDQ
ncbi:creatininase family protein [Actinoplanes sp. CA-030573]|uniref:creatininase family protein n=1 Tax=Actinoplanes sp. CA-030573 TaxID=3239898 RepID=UPI003D8C732C